jgi:hypothetical protein
MQAILQDTLVKHLEYNLFSAPFLFGIAGHNSKEIKRFVDYLVTEFDKRTEC